MFVGTKKVLRVELNCCKAKDIDLCDTKVWNYTNYTMPCTVRTF